jgi:hypothetical protein
MHDSAWRFEPGDGRHPPFSDEEIDAALDEIGASALPYLKRWLVYHPSPGSRWWNGLLARLHVRAFQFAERDYALLAEVGFQYYAQEAQPHLPLLVELTRSADPYTRMLAYEAAFFTRPGRDVFLPIADRALHDPAAKSAGAAAQWMIERFPEEAGRRNLKAHYSQFYSSAQETGPN